MLPITNRRAFHIPHSIATVAAIAALITAIGWDASNPELDRNRVESTAKALEATSTNNQPDRAAPKEVAQRARTGSGTHESGTLSGLLPLVLPVSSGRR